MLIRWLYGQATFFDLLTWALGIVVAITVHEFAHAYAAFKSGDDTAKRLGRLSLNPLAHFDPVGTTLILIAGMGWGKPVPVDPWRFKNPRWDDVKVSFAGPASNLIVVAVLLAVARNI
ncbi:MAG: site-2 protease family protein, partial [Armatimonadota bacterium]